MPNISCKATKLLRYTPRTGNGTGTGTFVPLHLTGENFNCLNRRASITSYIDKRRPPICRDAPVPLVLPKWYLRCFCLHSRAKLLNCTAAQHSSTHHQPLTAISTSTPSSYTALHTTVPSVVRNKTRCCRVAPIGCGFPLSRIIEKNAPIFVAHCSLYHYRRICKYWRLYTCPVLPLSCLQNGVPSALYPPSCRSL